MSKYTKQQLEQDESLWPDGATHYAPETSERYAVFFKVDGDDLLLKRVGKNESWGLCVTRLPSDAIPRPAKPAWVPEVGVECEVYNESFEFAEWEKCTPLFIGNLKVVYESESCHERVCAIELLKFRPIKSERDLFLEKYDDVLRNNATKPRLSGHALYDAGCRFVEDEK